MPQKKRGTLLQRAISQRELFFMIIPVIIYVFIFSYIPLRGWVMAFQNYRPNPNITHQEWVGFKHFIFMFSDDRFFRVMRNTIVMSVMNLILGFVTAIFFALLLNEIRSTKFKRFVQTVSYMPHFLSWVIAVSMITDFLSTSGILNTILMNLNFIEEPIIFLAEPDKFWPIIGISYVWKSMGWNSIIYLAAITSISPDLYESADLDGAGRFAKMWHITLPGIKSTILVLLIMNIGQILNAGFEAQYLMGNSLTWDVAETIDVFVMRYGIGMGNYSLATAFGMFKTVVSVILITTANQLSKRFAQESLV
jgi:putative aldouronate transport system permease protein